MRVAAGAVARKILTARLGNASVVRAALVQVGPHKINRDNWDWEEVDKNPFFSPDEEAAARWSDYLDDAQARLLCRCGGRGRGGRRSRRFPGSPFTANSIRSRVRDDEHCAVKGVEIGDGFDLAAQPGEEAADEMRMEAAVRSSCRTGWAACRDPRRVSRLSPGSR